MRTLLTLIVLFTLATGCIPPPLEYTKGQVRFAKSRDAFYDADWQKSVPANQSKICAGFVHNKLFGHYLKYGAFRLVMALQVFKGGTPVVAGSKVTGWRDGTLLRTLKRKIKVGERNNRGGGHALCLRAPGLRARGEREDGHRCAPHQPMTPRAVAP